MSVFCCPSTSLSAYLLAPTVSLGSSIRFNAVFVHITPTPMNLSFICSSCIAFAILRYASSLFSLSFIIWRRPTLRRPLIKTRLFLNTLSRLRRLFLSNEHQSRHSQGPYLSLLFFESSHGPRSIWRRRRVTTINDLFTCTCR